MNQYRNRDNLIGQASSFLEVLDHVSLVAAVDKPVLIIGERGTGKELIAERIHYLSNRWQQSYLKLNCATLNENVLESELFGHESGAFTGAVKRHQGRFERADNGTLFIDELANTSRLIQQKLLTVIEYGEFERVGGDQAVKTDVRLICATNEDLPSLVEQGRFRADLLDRLAFDVITLPPLRQREEDILILAQAFAVNMARQLELEYFAGFSPQAKLQLQQHTWPGNVRELKNVVERSLYRHNNPTSPLHQIVFDPFSSPYRPATSINKPMRVVNQSTDNRPQAAAINELVTSDLPLCFKSACANFEMTLIKQALQQSGHRQNKAAQLLGITYHQLRGLLKKYPLFNDK
jgi:psp operon transcriptional activator